MPSPWEQALQCDTAEAVMYCCRYHSNTVNEPLPDGRWSGQTPLIVALHRRNQVRISSQSKHKSHAIEK